MMFPKVKLEYIAAPVRNAIADGPFGSNLKLTDYVEKGIPVLQGKNITNNRFVWSDIRFISEKKAEELSRSKVVAGDLLMIKIGSIGYAAIVDGLNGFPFAIIPANLAKITPDLKKVFPKFLFYFISSAESKNKLMGLSSKTAQPAISLAKIKEFEIPLPDLKTQQIIANILEQADAARQKRKQANALTEQFLQSTFLNMFGDPEINPMKWDTGIINDVIEYSEYGTSNKSNQEKSGHPILGMSNITISGQLDLTKLSYVEIEEAEYKKLKLEYGDIIFNRTNSTELVGKTTYWNEKIDAVLASYLVKLRLNKRFNPICFSFLMNTEHFKKMFMRRCKKAVGQSNISPTLLKEFPIYIPPIKQQQKFAQLVEQVEKLRSKQRESEKELEGLFQSLMQKFFQ